MATLPQIGAGWSLIGVVVLLAFVGLVYSRIITAGKRLLTTHWVLLYLLYAAALLFTFTGGGPPYTPASTFVVLALVSYVIYSAAMFATHVHQGVAAAGPLSYAAAFVTAALAATHPASTSTAGLIGMSLGGLVVSLWACFAMYEYFMTRDRNFAFGVVGGLVARLMFLGIVLFFGTSGLRWLDEISEGIFVVFTDGLVSTLLMAYITWAFSGDSGTMANGYVDESMMTGYDEEKDMMRVGQRGLL